MVMLITSMLLIHTHTYKVFHQVKTLKFTINKRIVIILMRNFVQSLIAYTLDLIRCRMIKPPTLMVEIFVASRPAMETFADEAFDTRNNWKNIEQ